MPFAGDDDSLGPAVAADDPDQPAVAEAADHLGEAAALKLQAVRERHDREVGGEPVPPRA
jgi:hypothetical protein